MASFDPSIVKNLSPEEIHAAVKLFKGTFFAHTAWGCVKVAKKDLLMGLHTHAVLSTRFRGTYAYMIHRNFAGQGKDAMFVDGTA